MEIDDTDRRLLTVLQRHGRITNAELSERVHLSPSACHRRVQRLEGAGIIRAWVALLDPRAVDRRSTVFVEIKLASQSEEVLAAFERAVDRRSTVFVEIKLASQSEEVLAAFERAVAAIPDVLECHLMAGAADYLLKILARDTEDFARIHRSHLSRLPGVAQMQSSFALRTVVSTTAIQV